MMLVLMLFMPLVDDVGVDAIHAIDVDVDVGVDAIHAIG